jgi:hypothetical protein
MKSILLKALFPRVLVVIFEETEDAQNAHKLLLEKYKDLSIVLTTSAALLSFEDMAAYNSVGSKTSDKFGNKYIKCV